MARLQKNTKPKSRNQKTTNNKPTHEDLQLEDEQKVQEPEVVLTDTDTEAKKQHRIEHAKAQSWGNKAFQMYSELSNQ